MNMITRFMQRARHELRSWRLSGSYGVGNDALAGLYSSGRESSAGVLVTEESSMSFGPVYAAVRLLSTDIAGLPYKVYRMGDNGSREEQKHAVALMMKSPDGLEMTGYTFRETRLVHLLLWGNAYAEIVTDKAGRPKQLKLIHPSRVQPVRHAGVVKYEVTHADDANRVDTTLEQHEILHYRNLGFDGVVGESVITLGKDSIGEGQAQQKIANSFLKNGGRMGGVLQKMGLLNDDKKAQLKKQWRENTAGVDNAGNVLLLEGDAEYKSLSMPLKDAELLQSRRFTVEEIARWFGVKPHMIGDLSNATYSNITEQKKGHYEDLIPWMKRIETEDTLKLLPGKTGLFLEHNLDGILKGDIEKRNKAYSLGVNWGWLCVNEIRRFENMAPIPGGEIFLVPVNMMSRESLMRQVQQSTEPIEPDPVEPTEEPKPDPVPEVKPEPIIDEEQKRALRIEMLQEISGPVVLEFLSNYSAMVHGIAQRARKRAGDHTKFGDLVENHFPAQRAKMTQRLAPIVDQLNRMGLEVNLEQLVQQTCDEQRAALDHLIDTTSVKDLPAAVERVVSKWEQEAVQVAKQFIPEINPIEERELCLQN